MKSLGQNFLKNDQVLSRAAEALDIGEKDTIIEIGPGHGELTDHILTARPARVISIEKDSRLIGPLKEMAGLEVQEGDALEELPGLVRKIRGSYKIAGNIPYYITGHLLRVISELPKRPARTVLVIQKEVGERIVALPPRMNRLSAAVRFWAEPKILMAISAREFSPPPKVDSVLILLETKPRLPKGDSYYQTLRALFSQPRKTAANNLVSGGIFGDRKAAVDAMEKLGLRAEARPQDFSVENILLLTRCGE